MKCGCDFSAGTADVTGLAIVNFFLVYFWYPFSHFLRGILSDIKFEGFYRYGPSELGLKIEYKSYLRAGTKREFMFGFAVVWVFASQVILILATYIFEKRLVIAPVAILCLFTVAYLIETRKKTGELYRFSRERRINAKFKRGHSLTQE